MMCRKGERVEKRNKGRVSSQGSFKCVSRKITNVKINYTNLSINSLNSEPIKTCLKEHLG